eukprot:scaffold131297_cov79-Cyclotella_meneghiniana.AAC.1
MDASSRSSHQASIENRRLQLKSMTFKMHNTTLREDYYNEDELLHSEVMLHEEDASHGNMSAISRSSRTFESSAVGSKSPTVLNEGDDTSFYSQAQQRDDGIEGDDASRRSYKSSLKGGSSRRGSVGRYQETKHSYDDDTASKSSSRRSSSEPEGEYQPQQRTSSATNARYEDAMRARRDAVEQYSSLARKKASLLTNHNFDARDDDKSRRSSSRKTTPPATSSIRKYAPPPPPFTSDHQDSMVGKSVFPDDASTVSSMTSMDSYMKQQYILREMQHIRSRESRSASRGTSRSRRRDYSHGRRRSSLERSEWTRSHRQHTRSRSAPKESRSLSMPRDRSSRPQVQDLESIWEQEDSRSRTQHSTSSRSEALEEDSAGTKSDTKSFKKNPTCGNSQSTSNTPTLSQIEECCIKHPQVLLSDQVDVNVWTCMRYCKDEKTGRWITKKKVCQICLEEDEENGYHEHHSSRRNSRRGSSHLDDSRTRSMSSSEEEGYNRTTVNLYTDDGNQTPLEREAEAQRRRFVRRLAARAYHFPGNTWCEDWLQYICNTHIVFGIFFHHPLHPVTSRERGIILLGSVAVGVLISNLIYLWFLHENFGMNDVLLHIDPGIDITKLMITLWTLGSFSHTMFDLSVWHIKACTLCRYGGEVSDNAVKCGRRSGITIVLLTLAFATYLCLVRASQDAKFALEAAEGNSVDTDDMENTFFHPVTLAGSRKSFDFLLGYIIEFVLSSFVYGPVLLTTLFSGIFGCKGRIPILGGRPREMAKEQRYAMKRQRYIMPRTLKLGDEEFEADMWGDEELMTKF